MKLGIVKAVSCNPESDLWDLSIDPEFRDAVVKNQYFMTNADESDASVMRIIANGGPAAKWFRVGLEGVL